MPSDIDEKDLSHYVLPLNQLVVNLDCDVAFNGCSSREKFYAHYLSQALWFVGMIVPVQTSPESPVIFAILLDIFKSNGIPGLKKRATETCGFSEDDWKAFLVYTVGIFSNAGNYKSFGDTKIIPGVSLNLLNSLITKAKFYGMSKKEVMEKWSWVKCRLYSLSDREKQLGLGNKGMTTHFSANCTYEDAELVNRFMKEQKVEGWMTRVFKTSNGAINSYEIRAAAVRSDSPSNQVYDFEDAKFTFSRGDYSHFLAEVCQYLAKAKEFAHDETQVKMLDCYIKSFTEGSLEEHINGCRFWIADKGAAIESFIGILKNYRGTGNPYGIRSEFQSFVSVMYRPMSKVLQTLVDNASAFLKHLPWGKDFEKDVFVKLDFTSLDVLTFAGSGIPTGMNISYYEILQQEETKNVSLGNVIRASFNKDPQKRIVCFLSKEDGELFSKLRIESFEVQVALHEFGHGTGKLFTSGNGIVNHPSDLRNPLTNELVEGSYGPGETWSSVFTTLATPYEECRAESVVIYLSLFDDILKIFNLEGERAEEIRYVNWLSMAFAGAVEALVMYQPDTKTWMQAHSKARFVIMNVLIEAGQGLLEIEEKFGEDGQPDLLITLDRTKINTVGREAMKKFLLKLQIYKSTANIKSATEMFEKYAAVNNEGPHPWVRWRSIVLAKKPGEAFFVQHNTAIKGDTVILKKYDSTLEGLIQSWIERFRFEGTSVYKGLDECWHKDEHYF